MSWEIAILGFMGVTAFLFAYIGNALESEHTMLKLILFSLAVITLIIGAGATINVADMNPVNATAMPQINTTLSSQRLQTNTQSFYQLLIWGAILITIYLIMQGIISFYKAAKGVNKR